MRSREKPTMLVGVAVRSVRPLHRLSCDGANALLFSLRLPQETEEARGRYSHANRSKDI